MNKKQILDEYKKTMPRACLNNLNPDLVDFAYYISRLTRQEVLQEIKDAITNQEQS